MRKIRESGIDLLGVITWGAHFAQVYHSRAEYLELMIPFIDAGLRNNELCVWVYSSDADYLYIKEAMAEAIPFFCERLERGQLLLIPYTEFYTEGGSFSCLYVMNNWNQMAHHALHKGLDGLRLVRDTAWVDQESFADIMEYDHILSSGLANLPVIIACLFNADNMDVINLAKVIGNHNYVISKLNGGFDVIHNMKLLVNEKQIYKSMENYFRLIQLLPVPILIHDAEKIYYCNQSAVSFAGVKDTHELLGMKISDLLPEKINNNLSEFIEKTLSDQDNANYSMAAINCANGEVKPIELTSIRYSLNEKDVVLSVVRDISPFQKINRLEAAIEDQKALLNDTLEYDRMKTEFFSNISHELRTPLNVIMSIIQLIKLKNKKLNNTNSENDHFLKIMQQNCYRLLRLVNNLIDITKIDSNYLEMHRRNVDIVDLIEQIIMSVVEFAKNKGILVRFDSNIRSKIISCDPEHMERIMLNLLSNAIKFTEWGGEIQVSIMSEEGDKLFISVKDTGIGIPPDKQEIIFNRFQQADGSLTRKAEGSGIGLSLVKALVEMHNGSITLNSEEGKGSEFIVQLPCEVLPDTELRQADNSYDPLSRVDRLHIEFSDIYT